MQDEIDNRKLRETCPTASGAVLRSRELFQGRQRVDIEHQGEIYRLQITRRGKLILTK